MNEENPIALQAYEELAEAYAACVETKPHNAYYDRPAVLGLLPEVAGRRILDAGCGPGVYADALLQMGAEVMALDVSPKMVALAQQRLCNRAEVMQADITKPMPFLNDESFDLVVSPLVLGYVKDLKPVYQEFHRVLRRPGHFVFSESHPFFDFVLFKTNNYFATELVGCEWKGFEKRVFMPCYRRPLSAIVNPLIEVGFILERILEPVPTDDFKRADPKDYEELSRRPGFICFRARK